jgi:hypothetical protein
VAVRTVTPADFTTCPSCTMADSTRPVTALSYAARNAGTAAATIMLHTNHDATTLTANVIQYGATPLRPRRARVARLAAETMPGIRNRNVSSATGHTAGGFGRAALCISSGYGTSSWPCGGSGDPYGATAPYTGAGGSVGAAAQGGAVG